jgi:hypothetical protein
MKLAIPSHSPPSSGGLLLAIGLSLPLAAVASIALDRLDLDHKCTAVGDYGGDDGGGTCRLVVRDRETGREIKLALPSWLR